MTTFLSNVDTQKVKSLMQETDNNTELFTQITNEVVTSYTKDLDAFMIVTRKDLDENGFSTEELEDKVLNLSNMLYFIGEKLELVGIKEDVAKAARQEIYNKAYLENDVTVEVDGKKVKPTKDANQAVAEEKSKYETVVHSIFERTYKIIKFKVDAGYEFLSSLKKVLSRRMQEDQIQYKQPKMSDEIFSQGGYNGA